MTDTDSYPPASVWVNCPECGASNEIQDGTDPICTDCGGDLPTSLTGF